MLVRGFNTIVGQLVSWDETDGSSHRGRVLHSDGPVPLGCQLIRDDGGMVWCVHVSDLTSVEDHPEVEEELYYATIQSQPQPDLYQRRKLFTLGERDLLELFRRGQDRWFRVELFVPRSGQGIAPARIPPTAIIDGVRYDPVHKSFSIVLCDPSFDVVPQGQECPWGGTILLKIGTTPDGEGLARELEAAHNVIHDLREQLKG